MISILLNVGFRLRLSIVLYLILCIGGSGRTGNLVNESWADRNGQGTISSG